MTSRFVWVIPGRIDQFVSCKKVWPRNFENDKYAKIKVNRRLIPRLIIRYGLEPGVIEIEKYIK